MTENTQSCYKIGIFFLGALLLFIFGGGLQPPLSSAAQREQFNAEHIRRGEKGLEQLKIEALKKKLRLPKGVVADFPRTALLFKSYDENRFQEVVDKVISLPEEERSAEVSLLFGNSLFFLGEKEKAVEAYQQAYRLAINPQEEAAAMANFGLVLSTQGGWKEAIRWMKRALEIDRETDNWLGQGVALSLLGTMYYQSGDTSRGAAAHIEALEIAETIPIRWLEASQLTLLGNLYYLDRVLDLAREYHAKALNIYQKLDDRLGEAASLTGLSVIHKDQGRFFQALTDQSAALAIYQRLDDRSSQAKALLNLSLIYRDQGEMEAAIESGEKALRIQEALGDFNGMAQTEGTIGTIYQKKGELAEAIRHLEKAKALFKKAGASQQIHAVELRIQTLRDQM